jgi:ATP-dependent RNA helicase RhlE
VLDEFDRMLDQGFLPAVRRILRLLPERHQTLLFSATAPAGLQSVVKQIVRNPVRISASKHGSTNRAVTQSVRFVDRAQKRTELAHILQDPAITCAMVFTRTKHGADRVVKHLTREGIAADAIHGNKSQAARQRTLGRFRLGTLRVLVATDVAARGIDVDDVSHVINFDLPSDSENYVHRIGRTARAGRSGTALSLCSDDERGALRRIEQLIGTRLAEQQL